MKLREWSVVAISGFFYLLLQTLSTMAGAVGAGVCACLLPFLNRSLLKFYDFELGRWWLMLLAPTLAITVGVTSVKVTSPDLFVCLLAALGAFALSASVSVWLFSARRRCALCSSSITSRQLAFRCPRCDMVVCEKTCWNFDSLRCRLCHQNRVPIFSADGRWWDQNFGKSSRHGRCQLCLASPVNLDLRLCGRYGRPYCRACWDHQNGCCGRCGWLPPNLPEPLQAYLRPLGNKPNAQISNLFRHDSRGNKVSC